MPRGVEEMLAGFVAARDRGDLDTMLAEWRELVIVMWPHAQSHVDRFGWRRMNADERRDAAQDAATRLLTKGMKRNDDGDVAPWFTGTTVEELQGYVRKVAIRACQDFLRKAGRWTQRNTSYDRPVGNDDDQTTTLGERADAQQARRDPWLEDDVLDSIELEEIRAFMDWALPQVAPTPRKVFELLRAGKTVPQVMQELDMKENTVHVNSKRATDQLRALWEQDLR